MLLGSQRVGGAPHRPMESIDSRKEETRSLGRKCVGVTGFNLRASSSAAPVSIRLLILGSRGLAWGAHSRGAPMSRRVIFGETSEPSEGEAWKLSGRAAGMAVLLRLGLRLRRLREERLLRELLRLLRLCRFPPPPPPLPPPPPSPPPPPECL